MTARQREVLICLRRRYRDNQAPVTTNDLADRLSITVSTVRDHMRPLRKLGLIYHPYDEYTGKTRANSGWIPVPSEDKVIPLFRQHRAKTA